MARGYEVNKTHLADIKGQYTYAFSRLPSAVKKISYIKHRARTGGSQLFERKMLHYDAREALAQVLGYKQTLRDDTNRKELIAKLKELIKQCETVDIIPNTSDEWAIEYRGHKGEAVSAEEKAIYDKAKQEDTALKVRAKQIRRVTFLLKWSAMAWK